MTLPPEQIVQSASAKMQTLAGFSFLLDSQGAPAFIDSGHSYEFSQMKGDFLAPDRLQATFRVITPGLVTDVKTICIGDQQWETNFVTGEWVLLPKNESFNPMQLFDPQTGLQSIANDLSELKLEGLEELDTQPGLKLYAISGKIKGTHLNQLSYGMISDAPMDAKIWIEPTTFNLYRVRMVDSSVSTEKPAIWVIDFWNFDQVSKIEPPQGTPQ